MRDSHHDEHDVIILGAGPAGFTAGIYLGRFGIRTLLLETVAEHSIQPHEPGGRSAVSGRYHNVPGFSDGVSREEFKWQGIQQAIRSGCEYRIDKIQGITRDGIVFKVNCDNQIYIGRTLFFALGVQDAWPNLPGLEQYAGQCLFWSVEANGFEARDKMAGILGNGDPVAMEALRLFLMNGQATLLTHGEPFVCSPRLMQALEQCRIPVHTSRIKTIVGQEHCMSAVQMESGLEIPMQVLFFYETAKHPRSELAQELGVHVDSTGFIQVNERFETNVPNIYAVGDITARGREQVVTACYQGMEAAWSYYEDRFHHTTNRLFGFPEDEALSSYHQFTLPLGEHHVSTI